MTQERGHGRQEKRYYTVIHEPQGIRDIKEWAKLCVIGHCYSERTEGGKTSYERIVIFIQGGPTDQLSGAAADAAPPAKDARFDGTDDFLVTLGRMLVARQLPTGTST